MLVPPEPKAKWATRGIPRGPARGVELAPGEDLVIPGVDRLSAWSITVTPSHLEPYLEVRRAGVGLLGARLMERTSPDRLRDGQLLMQTGPEPSHRYSVRLSEDAPESAQVNVVKVASARTLHYWEHRRDALLLALDDELNAKVPAGLGLPGDDDAARMTQLGKELIHAAKSGTSGRVAARHLARAWVLREVERARSYTSRYHERTKLSGWVGEFTQRMTSEQDPVEKMWSIGITSPQQVIVEGPARIDFRVRGVLPKEEPDKRLDFSFEVLDVKSGALLHRADMSSRAALMDVPEAFDASQTKRVPRRLKGGDGEVLTWARETSFWVPPGKHRYVINSPDADVRIDADVLRVRAHAQDKLDQRFDITHQLELATRALKGSREDLGLVLGVELDLFAHRMDDAYQGLRERASPIASDAPLACWTYWRAMQHLELEPDAAATASCAARITQPERNTRLIHVGVQKLIQKKEFAQALIDLDLSKNPEDERLVRDRAEVWLKGGPTESARWFGMGLLLADWAAHPLDRERRTATQRAWWYNTQWQRVEPDGRQTRYEFLERLGPAHQKLSTALLAERKGVLYRLIPGEPHEVMLEPAPDDPERPARLKLLGAGFEDVDYHSLTVDDQLTQFVRTKPFERLDVALPHGAHTLVAEDRAQQARLFSYDLPINKATVRASDVVERRRYAKLTHTKSLTWSMTPSVAPRQVRLMLRMAEPLKSQRLTLDTGLGERRYLEYVGAPTDSFEDASPTLVFEVPAGSDRVTLSLDSDKSAPLFASLQVRQVGVAYQPLPLEPGVIQGLAIPEIKRLEVLTAELGFATDPTRRTELRVQRAELLMLLDQESLAKVDLQAVLLAPRDAGKLWVKAWRMMLAVEIRQSSNWLNHPRMNADEVMPTKLSGHVLNTRLANPGDCLVALRRMDPASAQNHSAECLHAVAYVQVKQMERDESTSLADMLTLWQQLVGLMRDHRHTWDAHQGYARALLDLVEDNPGEAPVGAAAQSYGLALQSIFVWPSSRVRSTYFRALRWTGWKMLKPPAMGRKVGAVPATEEVENMRDPFVTPASLLNDRKDAVEFAMLGSMWSRLQSFALISGVNHRKRFVAPSSGELVIQTTCQDIRPDLQPPGHDTPCDWFAQLFDEKGVEVPEIAYEEGRRRDTRVFNVEKDQHYSLRIRRLDTLRGREFIARARIDAASPWHYSRRGVLTFNRRDPLDMRVAGPAVLRLDVRQMGPDFVDQLITISHTSPSGELKEYTLDLSTTALDELPFRPKKGELSSTQPVRHILWLSEAGDHRIKVTSSASSTLGARVSARVDDYTEEFRSDGQGWRIMPTEFPAQNPPQSKVNQGLFASIVSKRLELGELDLSLPPARPWVVGGQMGWRARDLGGELGIKERARDRSYFYLEGTGSMLFPRLNFWLTPRAGLRSSVGMNPTIYAGGRATWMYDSLERIRFEVDTTFATQNVVEDDLRTLRGFAGVQYRVDWSERWSQRSWVRARWRPELGPESQDLSSTDPWVRSAYAKAHPITYELDSAWRWRPFMDAWLDLGGILRLNTNATPDQLRLKASATMRLGQSVMVGLDYIVNPLFSDRDRSRLFMVQELRGDLEWWGWHLDEHWFAMAGWGSVGLVLPSEQPFRLRAGASLSYRYSRRGWEAIPPSRSVVKDLRQPLYFGRRARPSEETP